MFLGRSAASAVCVRARRLRASQWLERKDVESSPEGATELSPALQRWEEWQERFKSRRDGRVLTHTLKRWLFAGGAPAPHCPHLLRHGAGHRGEPIGRAHV